MLTEEKNLTAAQYGIFEQSLAVDLILYASSDVTVPSCCGALWVELMRRSR